MNDVSEYMTLNEFAQLTMREDGEFTGALSVQARWANDMLSALDSEGLAVEEDAGYDGDPRYRLADLRWAQAKVETEAE